MPNNIKREIAYKVRIKDILDGRYIKEEGEWVPNYAITADGRRISRANIIGIVIAKKDDFFIIDDGAKISARFFNGIKMDFDVGDTILLIGRIREFNNEIYIVPDATKRIDNRWMDVRKHELSLTVGTSEPNGLADAAVENKAEHNEDGLIETIKRLDNGNGADVGEILKMKGSEMKKVIESLLKNGDIFEIVPGKIKVLE